MAQPQQSPAKDRRQDVESLACQLFVHAMIQAHGKTVESVAKDSLSAASAFYRVADESGRVERPGS